CPFLQHSSFCYNPGRRPRPVTPNAFSQRCVPHVDAQAATTGQPRRRIPPLRELVDVEILQRIQDWFAATTGLATRIRDVDGSPITKISGMTTYCSLIAGTDEGARGCSRAHRDAMKLLQESDEPVRYDCHGGLIQIAAPIRVEGELLGMVVIGQSPEQPLSPEFVQRVARASGVDEDELQKAATELTPWSDEVARHMADVLMSVANTISELSFQGYELRRNLQELSTLYEVAGTLTRAETLADTLHVITKAMTETLGVKGCSLRLLNEATRRLDPASYYNLTAAYRYKGPVPVGDSIYDSCALAGDIVVVPDVRIDPNFRYRENARKEGLVSMLCVGLEIRGKAIGVARVYTSEPREFTVDEIELMRALANHAAVAIDRARLVDRLQEANRQMREAYERLATTQDQLVHAEKLALIGELGGGIAHEVKGPLSGILFAAANIRDHLDTMSEEQVKESCSLIVEEARRVREIIDQVREYAKPAEADERTVESLADIVSEVLAFMKFDEDARDVTLSLQSPDGDVRARVNRDHVKQILMNLVRNAAQAVRPGTGHVDVRVSRDGDCAVLQVRDDGVGIPQEHLDRIWQPFFTTKGRGGTGLGLDVVRRLVAAQEGTISVESEVGRGSTFTVRLPLAS
ncbi:MAG: PocR ligand-binding domain-containing protein, partial [Armatimonadota bacterium]